MNSDDSDCECSDGVTRFSVTATGIGVTIAVAATVLLVVGSEMSVQNGKFASLSMLKGYFKLDTQVCSSNLQHNIHVSTIYIHILTCMVFVKLNIT